jgi:DNA-binding NarL/FixJ family response regulator
MRTTILIADDNSQVRMFIRRMSVQEPGLEVVGEAEDGAEAIRLTHIFRPDIVLLDIVMPRLNGLEAMQRIKAERAETKVIIVTVHTEDAYRKAAEDSGADAFLLKKTLMTELLPTIRRMRRSISAPHAPCCGPADYHNAS